MNWLFLFITGISSTLVISAIATELYLNNYPSQSENTSYVSSNVRDRNVLAPKYIEKQAKASTVKVFAGQSSGSGTLVGKKDGVYTVVTNRHVLIFSKDRTYKIKTPDGKVHSAKTSKAVDFKDYDLALLQFSSDKPYKIASLSAIPSSLSLEEKKVFSVGFPIEMEGEIDIPGFYFTDGYIAQFSQREFGGGYQIGYTNSVEKGMSGGALLDDEGKVIGINGMHKYPLWGNPYQFRDGSLATKEQQEEMSQLAWAIPINTFLKLAPQFSQTSN